MRFSSGCITAGARAHRRDRAAVCPSLRGTDHLQGVERQRPVSRDGVSGQGQQGPRRAARRASGASMAIVMDPGNQKMLILMPAQKMYMEQLVRAGADATRASQQAGLAPRSRRRARRRRSPAISASTSSSPTTTARTSTPASPTDSARSCRRRAATRWPAARRAARTTGARKLGKDGFPLKVTKGNTTVMEVTKIEKMSLDPSLFSRRPTAGRSSTCRTCRGMRPPPQRSRSASGRGR